MCMRMSKIEHLFDRYDEVSLPLITAIEIKFLELIYKKIYILPKRKQRAIKWMLIKSQF